MRTRVEEANTTATVLVTMGVIGGRPGKGFDPKREEKYLGRLEPIVRARALREEIATQVAEDVGEVQFGREYWWLNGSLVDPGTGVDIQKLTARAGIWQENAALEEIIEGLGRGKTMVHLRPRDGELDYKDNCVDLWINNGEKVKWIRLVVNQDEREMREIFKARGDLLANPLATDLGLVEIFDLLTMMRARSDISYQRIEEVTREMLNKMIGEYGERLFGDQDLIFRLYSAVHDYLRRDGVKTSTDSESFRWYVTAPIVSVEKRESFGCAGISEVGRFAEGQGYFVNTEGRIIKGPVPEGFVRCGKCGVWYKIGGKCPFCG